MDSRERQVKRMKEQDIRPLIGLLENEQAVLSSLLGLEIQKNDILVSQDLSLLASLTERENLLSENLSNLEAERLTFCRQHELDGDLSAVIGRMPETLRERLSASRADLVDLLKKIKIYNEINSRILQEAIKFFRFSVSLLAGEAAGSRTYTPDGTEPPDGLSGRAALVLDRKI